MRNAFIWVIYFFITFVAYVVIVCFVVYNNVRVVIKMAVLADEHRWDSVESLYREDIKKAEKDVKEIVQDTFQLMGFADLVNSVYHVQLQQDTLSRLRDLDVKIRMALQIRKKDRLRTLFPDYVHHFISMIPKDERERFIKQIATKVFDSQSPIKDIGPAYTNKEEKTMKGNGTISKVDTYTSQEAAQILGVSSQTIRRWCEQGLFKDAYRTHGGHWRIPMENFKMTIKQAYRAEKAMEEVDRKSYEAGDIDEFEL